MSDRDHHAILADLARIGPVGPENSAHDLGATGADEASKADDLARARIKIDVRKHAVAG